MGILDFLTEMLGHMPVIIIIVLLVLWVWIGDWRDHDNQKGGL